MMCIESDFREPSPTERGLIQRLLEADFAGKSELANQLASCRVREIDSDGSLEFELAACYDPAPVAKRIPVEGDGVDEDGIHVHVLLHVVNGFVKELEIYKDDGSPIRRMPKARDLALVVLPLGRLIGG